MVSWVCTLWTVDLGFQSYSAEGETAWMLRTPLPFLRACRLGMPRRLCQRRFRQADLTHIRFRAVPLGSTPVNQATGNRFAEYFMFITVGLLLIVISILTLSHYTGVLRTIEDDNTPETIDDQTILSVAH